MILPAKRIYSFPADKAVFLSQLSVMLEQPAYRHYLLLDKGTHYIFRYQPEQMRPFGNDTGFTLKFKMDTVASGATNITAQEAYPMLFRGALAVFMLVGLFGAFFSSRYDWLLLMLLVVVGTSLINRSYTKSMLKRFDKIMEEVLSTRKNKTDV